MLRSLAVRAALLLSLLGSTVGIHLPASNALASGFPDPAYEKVWSRTDKPVADGAAQRTWMWGPEAFDIKTESYAQSPGGQRQVVYFDKSRMEINDPAGDRNSDWFVTNGLLVKEMISGKAQIGDNQFEEKWPAEMPVAGDPSEVNPDAPTYASFDSLASLDGDNRAEERSGQDVTDRIDRAGNVASDEGLKGKVTIAYYDKDLGHNIPNVFWDYFDRSGLIYQDGGYVESRVINWLYAVGHPIMEPYWATVKVGGADKLVLMQAFERRVLTYTPDNPDGWKVEMGNVGRHYNFWRYADVRPTETQLSWGRLSSVPRYGPPGTKFTITFYYRWLGYVPGETVNVSVARPDGQTAYGWSKIVLGPEPLVWSVDTDAGASQGGWSFQIGQWDMINRFPGSFWVTGSNTATVSVAKDPGTGPAAFQVDASGFLPNEQIDVQFVSPSGIVWTCEGHQNADAIGNLKLTAVAGKQFPLTVGEWTILLHGDSYRSFGYATFPVGR